ncbi:MAG: DUF6364 family protein [Mongoliitalea sp.]
MSTKLTLTIDKSVIESAKSYAKDQGKSLSQVIENYLKTLTDDSQSKEVSANVKKLIGTIKLPEDFEYKKELEEAIAQKYLKK